MIMFSLKKQRNIIQSANIDTEKVKSCDQTVIVKYLTTGFLFDD